MYCPKPQQYRFKRLTLKSTQGEYDVTLGDNSCSTGISGNAVRTQLSLIGNEQPLREVGDRVHHRKDPDRAGTVIKPVEGSTRFFIAWDVGGKSAVEGRNLSLIPVEQGDPWKLLTADPDYLSETNGQLTIFSEDEPPEPDDFESEAAYLKAWAEWELQYPQLAEAVRQTEKETQTIPVEQNHQATVNGQRATEEVNDSQSPNCPLPTPHSPIKPRNTKPGRGSRPKQVACNVKRNGSKGKSANTYWVYKFSFKVDGKYYDRSVSIPKEKVNRVLEMWDSKQYSWRDIVEYIGKNPVRGALR